MQFRRQSRFSSSLFPLRIPSLVNARGRWAALCSLGALAALTLLPSVGYAQTLAQGKSAVDAADYPRAASIFETVRDSGAGFERPRAAVEVLRAWNASGREDQVAAAYEKSLVAATGTEYEPQCMLERGKSLQYNAHDTTGALALYGNILTRFPDESFSASGSLYQRGLIELDNLKTPSAALATFQGVTNRYTHGEASAIGDTAARAAGSSPFVDDSLVAQCRAAISLGRLDVIDAAQQRLRDIKADLTMQQKAQFQRAEYMSKARVSREHALKEYIKTYRDFPGDIEAAGHAKIRAADLVPAGDFRAALSLYAAALRDSRKLNPNLRSWAQLQTGIYQFQLGDEKAARSTLQELRGASPPPAQKAEVEKYLTGLTDPDSTESILITYDRGIRYRQTGMGLDRTFEDMQRILAKSRGPRAKAFLKDERMSSEERAQMRYRVCFALFFSGRCSEAYDLAQLILDEEKPVGVTKWECLHMQAFLLGRQNDFKGSAERWQSIIDANPQIDFLPQCYMELGQNQDAAGDALGSVLTLEELRVRFPARDEAEKAQVYIDHTMKWNPGIRASVDEKKPAIIARWTGDRGGPPRGPNDMPPSGEPSLAAAVENANVGGAE